MSIFLANRFDFDMNYWRRLGKRNNKTNLNISIIKQYLLGVRTCRVCTTSILAALKDPVSRNRPTILVKTVERGQGLAGNCFRYIYCARHAFPCAWPYIRCMSTHSVFEYSDMIIAHSLIALAINAKLADDWLLCNSFLIAIQSVHILFDHHESSWRKRIGHCIWCKQSNNGTAYDSLLQTE